VESLDGLYIKQRIDNTLDNGKSGFVYKPRSGKLNLNTNEKYFSPEQKAYVLKSCKEYINFFGYA